MDKELSFEQGPIRPPNEARSLLLRVTRNCPWNQCMFCPVYKGRKFSLRTVEEIKQDIRTARDIAEDIKALSWKLEASGSTDDQVVSHIFGSSAYSDSYHSIAAWLYYGTGACFLQDADNLIMKTNDLVEVLEFLREKFPNITRVTTYSRQHIEAGRKVIEAGMELSEYVMPGLGGQEMWREHAVETARVLNQINPHFIRLRSLRVPSRVPLYEKLKDGTFTMQTDDMMAEEIRIFIENLDGITSTVTSDHIMNLLEEVDGKMPEDKEKMLEVVKAYQDLPESERFIYRVGRRGGAYRSTDDLKRDPVTYEKIKNHCMSNFQGNRRYHYHNNY
ncbi:MAG: hypothetical protein B1H12_01575 [Desulfobacteraceae bacterium 4484_190.2]|nr:MAG: hypothetical protein B1H12_01575 [Desulfobacteraceae bacterium 4484_190.2]